MITANWQTLPTGAQHWYRFEYSGNNLPVRISIDTNTASSAGFQVWTEAQFSRLTTNPGETPVASGAADANNPTHILWESPLAEPGTYYIVVQPTTQTETSYLLTIGGRGLAPAADGGAIVAGALNVNIRSGPSTAFPVLLTVPQGTQLSVLGQDTSSSWLSVRLADGAQGWIARFLTDFTATAAIADTPAQVQPPLAPPATTAPESAAIVAGALNVNARSGPSTNFALIRTIPQGTQFTVLGQDGTGTWLFVRFSDGVEGWVARYLTNFGAVVPVLAAPVVAQPPLAPPSTVPVAADPVAGTLNMNIRTGPSTGFAVIRSIPVGTQVEVLGQDASGTWLFVQLADGSQGWLSRSLTDFAGTVPVVTTTPAVQPPLAPPATVSVVPGTESLPSQAASLDNFPLEEALATNARILRGGQIQWFTFSHPGDDEPVQIWMDVDPNAGAEFRVFREEDAQSIMDGANPDEIREVGRGTPNENESGDLFWRGAFEEHGRYFVMVRSSSTNDLAYSIYGVGSTISQ
jgi:uncharacterized protein YraI